MEYEFDFRFSSFNEKWKMENGCTYSFFYFSFSLENENNGIYTDQISSPNSFWSLDVPVILAAGFCSMSQRFIHSCA